MPGDLNYSAVGDTRIADSPWNAAPAGYLRLQRTVRIGSGEQVWTTAVDAVERWAVKTRSGFTVEAAEGEDLRVRVGQDRVLIASIGPVRVREPVRVISTVNEPDRRGFAYGTRAGHPVSGEEAFVVHRSGDGDVWFTLRSLTRPAPGRWSIVFPAVLVAQRWYRRRYLRSLRDLG